MKNFTKLTISATIRYDYIDGLIRSLYANCKPVPATTLFFFFFFLFNTKVKVLNSSSEYSHLFMPDYYV